MQTLKKGDPNKTIAAKKAKSEQDFKEAMKFINEIDPRLAKTFYAIEADSYAYTKIWLEYKDKYNFVQDMSVHGVEIGQFGRKPVVLDFSWWIVNGHPVLFYYCMSQVSHWGMIEDWIKKYMPHLKYTSDAQNAHNVLQYCVEEKKEKPERIIKCYTCMDSGQVEERRIGYDSIMGRCPNC